MNIRAMALWTVGIVGLLILFFRPGHILPGIRKPEGVDWAVVSLDSTEDLTGVGGTGEAALFACGLEGGLYVIEPSGVLRDRSKVEFVNSDLAMDRDGRPWVASGYGLLHTYDGVAWSAIQGETAENFVEIEFAPDGTGWLGADGGALFRILERKIMPCGYRLTRRITGILALSKDEAYVSAEGGALVHVTQAGEEGAALEAPTDEGGWHILAPGPEEELVLLGAGGIHAMREGRWIPLSKPAGGSIHAVLDGGEEGLWAASDAGLIFRGKDTEWKVSNTGRSEAILALGRGMGRTWACGESGLLLRYEGAR